MTTYGQFCAVARAHEAVGGRWTLLVVRELLMGSRRFNDIRRGIPRISRTMLSERLQALVEIGAVERDGADYALTEAGRELMGIVAAFGTWGQRWLPRDTETEDLDAEPVLVDMVRRVRHDALPTQPLMLRFEIDGRRPPRFLLLKGRETALCAQNLGFPEPLRIRTSLASLTAWWRGDTTFARAQREGLTIEGPKTLIRAFPGWFERYLFADIAPAHEEARAP